MIVKKILHKPKTSYPCSIDDCVIRTATPTFELCGSVRTTSPWHLSLILPRGLRNSTSKRMKSPVTQATAVQKNIPVALTSRVTPVAFLRKTGNAIWIRCFCLFSGSTAHTPARPRRTTGRERRAYAPASAYA